MSQIFLGTSGPIQVNQSGENLIKNGDFATDISQWKFEEFANEGPTPYATAEWDNGRVYMHAHDNAYANIRQEFSQEILPSKFEIDYERYLGSTCNQLEISFYNQSGNLDGRFLKIIVRGDNFYIYNEHYVMVLFMENDWIIITKSNPSIESGHLVLDYDYESNLVNISISDVLYYSLPFTDKSDLATLGVSLWTVNQCYDSREDAYGYYDNVSMVQSNEQLDTGSLQNDSSNTDNSNADITLPLNTLFIYIGLITSFAIYNKKRHGI